VFRAAIGVAALFNDKAKKWVTGRRQILQRLEKEITDNNNLIWVHCASLGEFEQGRPVMEALKETYKTHKILLTFFSPSGYEAQKNYAGADWIFYLPLDGPRTAKKFLAITNPQLVVFVKYEFWYFYLKKIKYQKIPLLLISALFRKDMSFFKWYGRLQRKMLSRFDHLFVQNQSSKQLMDEIGLGTICSVSGDTRFDRVTAIASQFNPLHSVAQFINNQPCIVAGSTWPTDEQVLKEALSASHTGQWKLIIAPHEINVKHIAALLTLFPEAMLFSTLQSTPNLAVNKNVLLIDNIGMLSRLYKYGTIAYVGGGFSPGGIHNVLEAAVYGKPVIWGPAYKKYTEAIGLINANGGLVVNNSTALQKEIETLLEDDKKYQQIGENAYQYVQQNTGATKRILAFIQENRLLTNCSKC
jgi:3-deoxy-D-manno-octulosonic-acid transferase